MAEVTKRRRQVQLPGSGEFYWVGVPDDYSPEMKPMNVPIGRPQIAGQNACEHCGLVFNSGAMLQTHIQAFHILVSGQADLRPVELPDGTSVPAAMVKEVVDTSQQQREAEMQAKFDQEKMKLEKEVADLTALVAESMTAPPRKRGLGRPRKSP